MLLDYFSFSFSRDCPFIQSLVLFVCMYFFFFSKVIQKSCESFNNRNASRKIKQKTMSVYTELEEKMKSFTIMTSFTSRPLQSANPEIDGCTAHKILQKALFVFTKVYRCYVFFSQSSISLYMYIVYVFFNKRISNAFYIPRIDCVLNLSTHTSQHIEQTCVKLNAYRIENFQLYTF